jgi:hypothetical protein
VVAVRTRYYDTKQYKHVPRPAFEIVSWAEPWTSPSGVLPEPEIETKAVKAPKTKKATETKKAEHSEIDPPFNWGDDQVSLFEEESALIAAVRDRE